MQTILTEYGCNIKTTIGRHDVAPNACSRRGVIRIELFGDDEACEALEDRLRSVEGFDVNCMVFGHP